MQKRSGLHLPALMTGSLLPQGLQGSLVNLGSGGGQVYAKPLSDGSFAFALLNPLWLLAGGRSGGTIVGRDGDEVELDGEEEADEQALRE